MKDNRDLIKETKVTLFRSNAEESNKNLTLAELNEFRATLGLRAIKDDTNRKCLCCNSIFLSVAERRLCNKCKE